MEDQEFEPFDKLLKEIASAESKLDQLLLNCHNDGDGKKSINLEAVALKEEDLLLRQEVPEGLVEDEESQYFIAVGLIEQEIENLRKMKTINDKQASFSVEELQKLRKDIAKQAEINDNLEEELTRSCDKTDVNAEKRKEFELHERFNKLNLKSLKRELKGFLDDTSRLQSQDGDGSKFGFLLQALWTNFVNNGVHEYVSIESLEFDVEQEVLEHLENAGVITFNTNNNDLIRLVNFTMNE